MEEVKNSEPKPSRLYCENDSCNKPRKHFCSDHNEVLCSGCFTALHVRCKCDEIPGKEDVVESLEVVKTLLTSINEKSIIINAESYIKNFEEEFNILQKTLIESSLFTEFTKLKELKLIAKGDNLSRQVAKDIQRSSMQKDLLDYKQKVIQEMEEHNRKKIEKKVKEETKEVISKSKQTIRELKNKIQEEEKVKEKLTKKNSKLTKELETERQNIQDMLEEQKQREEKEQKDRADRFNEIYQKHIGSKIANLSNFNFETSLSDKKQKDCIKDIVAFKLRLPDIKRIEVNNISDSDTDLVNSFLNSTPDRLKILCIDHDSPGGTPVKYKLDINSLSKAVAAVTKEVYISCFEFSAADLQQLIRAACNAERIVFYLCSVHCSSALDFGATIEYKTNYLGFDYCGSTSDRDLITDWKADPSCFNYIVDAIGNSGLKSSLTKLNICDNKTLKKQKVQELLNENGMGHIEVVEENSSLSTD